jgi:hypothetical protein
MGFTTPDFPDVEWNLAQVRSGSATDAEGTAAPLVGGRSPRRVGRNFKLRPRRRGRGRHSRYSPPHGFQELSGGTRWSAP